MLTQLLIDTDVLIDYLRGRADSVNYLEGLTEPLLMSVITLAELYAGVREGEERAKLEEFVKAFELVPISSENRSEGWVVSQRSLQEIQCGTSRRPDRGNCREPTGHVGNTESEAFSYA
jgi:predicted nucleic acid-binding protein